MAWERGFPGEGHISAGAPGEGPRDPPLPSPRYAMQSGPHAGNPTWQPGMKCSPPDRDPTSEEHSGRSLRPEHPSQPTRMRKTAKDPNVNWNTG